MELWKIVIILYFVCKSFNGVDGDCVLLLNKDFGSPQPVLLKNGLLFAPNTYSGDIYLQRSDGLTIACVGDRRFVVLGNETTKVQVLEAQCVSNSTFRVGQWVGPFKNITCNVHPWFTTDETSEKCFGGNNVFRVGYQIQNEYHKLYEICFNKYLLTTLYAKHYLTPFSKYTQNGGSRPQFVVGDKNIFGKIPIAELYKTKQQKERLNAILGSGMDKEYLTKNQFLTRGHLAARADFPLVYAQRASFHYLNAAPQWMRGNAGDWAALEEALRRRVHAYNSTVTVYTGTHGVSTLRNRNGNDKELFLHVDANNNEIVPVPLYFYKLIHDPKKKTATAFISINSSYYNSTMLEKLTFCSDICHGNKKFSWLKWRSNDGTHSFCCEYQDFTNKIDFLPKLYVNNIFY